MVTTWMRTRNVLDTNILEEELAKVHRCHCNGSEGVWAFVNMLLCTCQGHCAHCSSCEQKRVPRVCNMLWSVPGKPQLDWHWCALMRATLEKSARRLVMASGLACTVSKLFKLDVTPHDTSCALLPRELTSGRPAQAFT
jgi:hypothetical protein